MRLDPLVMLAVVPFMVEAPFMTDAMPFREAVIEPFVCPASAWEELEKSLMKGMLIYLEKETRKTGSETRRIRYDKDMQG